MPQLIRVGRLGRMGRPGGSVAWAPSMLTGLVHLWDYRSGVTVAGSNVTAWVDSVGGVSFDAAANHPTLVATGVRFVAASSQRLRYTTKISRSTAASLFFVYNPATSHTGTLVSDNTSNSSVLHFTTGATVRWTTSGTGAASLTQTAPAAGTRRVLVLNGNASGRSSFTNNVAGQTDATAMAAMVIEYLGAFNGASSFLNGDIETWGICSGVMGAADRAALQTWAGA